MSSLISTANTLFGLATVFGQIVIMAFIASFFSRTLRESSFVKFIKEKGVLLAFLVVLGSVLGSLFYSEVAGFSPCSLCWWERIVMYPQLIVLGIALWKKKEGVEDYILPLSGIGAIIALYHSYLQYGGSPFLPCASTGISCAQRYVFELGYITIPLMAFTAFFLVFLLALTQKKSLNQ